MAGVSPHTLYALHNARFGCTSALMAPAQEYKDQSAFITNSRTLYTLPQLLHRHVCVCACVHREYAHNVHPLELCTRKRVAIYAAGRTWSHTRAHMGASIRARIIAPNSKRVPDGFACIYSVCVCVGSVGICIVVWVGGQNACTMWYAPMVA